MHSSRNFDVQISESSYFTKDNGIRLPVSDDYLLPFLSPTSPGTNYWDSPPPGAALERQRGRVILQIHQILDHLSRCGIDLAGKTLLDVGTGNGMVPKLLLQFSDLAAAVGVDPYLDGEHKTSWQKHDQDALFRELVEFIDGHCQGALDYERYKHLAGFEHFTARPAPVSYRKQGSKNFRFAKIGAHDLGELDEKFDVFYCKAIDHIPDWAGIFNAIDTVAKNDSVICIKHFSFFSYLGPHRYATTNIPWGHLLLTDGEYRRFAHEFHPNRAEQMVDFYFTGLSYPRTPMSDLVEMARKAGFVLHEIVNEPLRNVTEFQRFVDDIPGFWDLVHENHPRVSAEELFSGRYHMVFKRSAR